MPSLERTRDLMNTRHALDTDHVSHARTSAVASRAMRRSRRLALALSVCMLGLPAVALADTATPAAATVAVQGGSPLEQALRPDADGVTSPVRYPEQSVILTWGDVPDAAGYTVEISDNPGFSKTIWTADTSQAIAVPEVLLPDGSYWWRVRAVDAAGTQGVWSDVARVAKTWPNTISGTRVAATPGRGRQLHGPQPVPLLEPGPGRQELRRPGLPGQPVQQRRLHGHQHPRAVRHPRRGRRAARRHLQLARPGPRPERQPRPLDHRVDTFTKDWTRPNQPHPGRRRDHRQPVALLGPDRRRPEGTRSRSPTSSTTGSARASRSMPSPPRTPSCPRSRRSRRAR